MKKNIKAISPIFATLIILAVVTALFIPVFIWAAGMTSQTEDSWETAGLIATERIVIEEVSLKADSPNCIIYVRNIGKTTVSVDTVFISLSDGTDTTHAYSKYGPAPTFTTSPDKVVQGELITLAFAGPIGLGFNPDPLKAYTVKVYTNRGVGDSYQAVT